MKYTRTQVYLDPDQHRSLWEEARNRGVSLAELVRQIVQRHFEQQDHASVRPKETYMKIVGLGSSGKKDVSARHDAYLGEALARDRAR